MPPTPTPAATSNGNAPVLAFGPITTVIMQPTTLCNLDCDYCYLPQRRDRLNMSPAVAKAVALGLSALGDQGDQVEVVWHGGEPTVAGIDALRCLVDAFDPASIVHTIQTNATRIDDAWCAFFAAHDIKVGISIDGPMAANAHRLDLAGRETWTRTMRGIERLRANDIPFTAIAVVDDPDPAKAPELLEFFMALGCTSLGLNIEETEGANVSSRYAIGKGLGLERTTRFWEAITAAWDANPSMHIREIDRVADYLRAPYAGPRTDQVDPIPTVAWDGKVTFLSPELSGYTDKRLGDFAAGNILAHDFNQLLARAIDAPWVKEFAAGQMACAQSCEYFKFCGGGQASNKFFEHERLDTTRTDYCTGSKITLMEGILAHARHRNPR
jgi:uncharacterized protein